VDNFFKNIGGPSSKFKRLGSFYYYNINFTKDTSPQKWFTKKLKIYVILNLVFIIPIGPFLQIIYFDWN